MPQQPKLAASGPPDVGGRRIPAPVSFDDGSAASRRRLDRADGILLASDERRSAAFRRRRRATYPRMISRDSSAMNVVFVDRYRGRAGAAPGRGGTAIRGRCRCSNTGALRLTPAMTSIAPPTPITNGTPSVRPWRTRKYSLRGELIATNRMSGSAAAIAAATAASSSSA